MKFMADCALQLSHGDLPLENLYLYEKASTKKANIYKKYMRRVAREYMSKRLKIVKNNNNTNNTKNNNTNNENDSKTTKKLNEDHKGLNTDDTSTDADYDKDGLNATSKNESKNHYKNDFKNDTTNTRSTLPSTLNNASKSDSDEKECENGICDKDDVDDNNNFYSDYNEEHSYEDYNNNNYEDYDDEQLKSHLYNATNSASNKTTSLYKNNNTDYDENTQYYEYNEDSDEGQTSENDTYKGSNDTEVLKRRKRFDGININARPKKEAVIHDFVTDVFNFERKLAKVKTTD